MSSNKRRLPIQGMSDTDDTLLQMIVAVTAQLAVTRERVDTLEALLVRHGVLPADAVETFTGTDEDAQRRDTLRGSLVAKVMEPISNGMQADLERLENDHA